MSIILVMTKEVEILSKKLAVSIMIILSIML